ncbi:F-box only protein 34 [Nelusetta ayraudi]|uniref:F-box only protein 34 n=1 Tax=Nelusetta ayraudi TaxID=303726 RepID=UPI003F72BB1E
MHLEPCLMRSELSLGVMHSFQQGAQHWSCRVLSANEALPRPKAQKPPPPDSGSNATEDAAAAALDIWSVIRPGHVREKIAIFASDSSWSDGECTAAPSVKTKRSWEEASAAKRSRRLTNRQTRPHQLSGDPPTPPQEEEEEEAEEEEEVKVSVVEMVAFLEQRVLDQQQQPPPQAVRRSCTSITLCRAPPPEAAGPGGARVSDLVARLECLRGRGKGEEPEGVPGGLGRGVRRLLLTPGSAPSPSPSPTTAPASAGEEEEPLPGLLFRSPPLFGPAPSSLSTPTQHPSPAEEEEEEPLPGLLFRSAPLPPPGAAPPPSPSQDFLLTRQRLRRLLEPAPPYLSRLPAHLLLQILRLLPTRSLAALKCCCRHFCRLIDACGVRPADALWVRDPRYRHDPCKRCRQRWRGAGDVSLCRWHHKAFWQAAPPHGPAYWLCCHAPRRDAPGCNVGLHDNRWVPPSCHGWARGQQDH